MRLATLDHAHSGHRLLEGGAVRAFFDIIGQGGDADPRDQLADTSLVPHETSF